MSRRWNHPPLNTVCICALLVSMEWMALTFASWMPLWFRVASLLFCLWLLRVSVRSYRKYGWTIKR